MHADIVYGNRRAAAAVVNNKDGERDRERGRRGVCGRSSQRVYT